MIQTSTWRVASACGRAVMLSASLWLCAAQHVDAATSTQAPALTAQSMGKARPQRANCDVPNPPPACDGGDPPTSHDPVGRLAQITFDRQQVFSWITVPAVVHFTGSAVDPDTSNAIAVQLRLDGATVMTVVADKGSGHQFDGAFSWTPVAGPRRFCLVAVNVAEGADKTLGCQDYNVTSAPVPAGIVQLTRDGTAVDMTVEDRSDNEDYIVIDWDSPASGWNAVSHFNAQPGTGTRLTWHGSAYGLDSPDCYRLLTTNAFSIVYGAALCLPTQPPEAPEITALLPTDTTATIWFADKSNNELGFKFERQAAGGEWTSTNLSVSSWAGMQKATTDRDLSPKTPYCYRVISFNNYGQRESAPQCTTTLRPGLPLPSDLTASGISSSSLTLSWMDNAPDEEKYQVIYRVQGDNNSAPIIRLPASAGVGQRMSTSISGLKADTVYCFAVSAQARDAAASAGATVCARTLTVVKITSFSSTPAMTNLCVPQDIRLNWVVENATELVIRRGGTEIFRDVRPGAGHWEGSFMDPDKQDGIAGGALMYGLNATNSATHSSQGDGFTVRPGSDLPLAAGLIFTLQPNADHPLQMQKLDVSQNRFVNVSNALVMPGGEFHIAFERCDIVNYRAVDPSLPADPPAVWNMVDTVRGWPTGPVLSGGN